LQSSGRSKIPWQTMLLLRLDNTPVTLTVSSANMNGDTYWARVKVEGYKYQLIKVKPKNPQAEPRVVLTVDVGQRQK
jgi:hypothetical protein